MKYLSTFSGIGGFEIGINKAYESLCNADGSEERGGKEDTERNKGQGLLATQGENICSKERPVSERITDWTNQRPLCVGYSEINKYADQIYKSKFPEHKNYGDITKINEKELPDFDLFVGGFPCQAFSIAGKRGGFDDTRGTLFFDCARILKEKQPRNFILENVKGLLSHDNGRTFKTIINTLTELGYCVEWQVLNAKNFGVPQNRERVFIVGHLGGMPERKVFPITGADREIDEPNGVQSVSNKRELSRTLLARDYKDPKVVQVGVRKDSSGGKQPFQQDRVYDSKGLSPSLQAQLPEGSHKIQVADYRNDEGLRIRSEPISPCLSARRHSETDISTMTNLIINPYNLKQSEVETGTLGTSCGTTTGKTAQLLVEGYKIRRLTPLECERLMSYPDKWTEGLSDTQRYKCLGNGLVSNIVVEIVKRLY